MKNFDFIKGEKLQNHKLFSSLLHPTLVPNRYFDEQARMPTHELQGCCIDCNLNTDWTVFFSVLDHL